MVARRINEPIEPMTLGNMRANGVRIKAADFAADSAARNAVGPLGCSMTVLRPHSTMCRDAQHGGRSRSVPQGLAKINV
jgi:hypothetical protein